MQRTQDDNKLKINSKKYGIIVNIVITVLALIGLLLAEGWFSKGVATATMVLGIVSIIRLTVASIEGKQGETGKIKWALLFYIESWVDAIIIIGGYALGIGGARLLFEFFPVAMQNPIIG